MEDELELQGILTGKDRDWGMIQKDDVEFIFNFCTQTGPYLSPLYDHMKQNGIVMNISLPKEELKISDIFSALDNAKFIKEIPAFLNHRQTFANIQMIKAAILIKKSKREISFYLIARALVAFQLMERELNEKAQVKNQNALMQRSIKKQESLEDADRVNKQMKTKEEKLTDTGSLNLPQDPKIINDTMRLIDRIMPEDVIKKWLQLVQKQLDCAIPDRKQFEKQVREIEQEIKNKNPHLANLPEVPFVPGYILPHEFLFLVCNSRPRQIEIAKQKALPMEAREIIKIDEFNPDQVNGIRLDQLKKLNIDAWKDWYTTSQPSIRMRDDLNAQNKGKKIRIIDAKRENVKGERNIEEDTMKAIKKMEKSKETKIFKKHSLASDTTSTEKNMQSNIGQSLDASLIHSTRKKRVSCNLKNGNSLSVIDENGEPRKTFNKETIKRFKKQIADPVFFRQLKQEVQNATDQLCKTRLGGQINLNYLHGMRDGSNGSPIRNILKTGSDFRVYIDQNPTVKKAAINFDNPISNQRKHKIMFEYKPVQDIESILKRIRRSQKSAIKKTYEVLKNSKDNIFSEHNVLRQKTNKTIMKALKQEQKLIIDENGLQSQIEVKDVKKVVSEVRTRRTGRDDWPSKYDFATEVRVQHKEPMEPQKSPSLTYYGVMNDVAREAHREYTNYIKSPAYQRQLEEYNSRFSKPSESEQPELRSNTKITIQKASFTQHKKNKEEVVDVKTKQINQAYEVQQPQHQKHRSQIHPRASHSAHHRLNDKSNYPQTPSILKRKHKQSNDLDCVSTLYNGSQPYGSANTTCAEFGIEAVSEATFETVSVCDNKRPMTAAHVKGERVKSAAASFIFRKWGYDTTKLLKDRSVDLATFIENKTLQKDHFNFMQRIDKAIEKDVVETDQAGRTSYDNLSIKNPHQNARDIEMLKLCPPAKEVFTRHVPKKRNILD